MPTKVCNFCEKAIKKYGDKCDYSQVEYINSYTKIKIKCKKHGYFWQKPSEHLRSKYPCPECRREGINGRLKHGYKEFLEKSFKLYGNYFDYSKKWYGNKRSKVLCPVHGIVSVNNRLFLSGKGCPKCGYDRSHSCRVLSNNDFIDRAKKVHGSKYDYTLTNYKHNKLPVKILCSKHGLFLQEPNNHLEGKGCSKCAFIITKFHSEIRDFLEDNNIDCIVNDRRRISPYEIDILCGDIGIECNGLFWHSYDRLETRSEKFRHYNKCQMALNKKLKLIQIFENEWREKQAIVKSILLSKFNKNKSIGARKCQIVKLSFKEFCEFMEKNHIQGLTYNSSVRYALVFNDQIVSSIGFNRNSIYDWEISRYANVLGFNVIGGLSKLFKAFLNENKPKNMVAYSDRRYFDGKAYKKLGFKLDGVTNPGYGYTDKFDIMPRQRCQKRKLDQLLSNFNANMTEAQNMFNNGYRRIWDAGHNRFVWNAY